MPCMGGSRCSDAPSHLSPPRSLTCAATSCFVTTAPKRACQALPSWLAQPLQNKVCNQKNGLQKKATLRHLFLFPTSTTVSAATHGPCGRTENSHSEGAFPWGCLCPLRLGTLGGARGPDSCHTLLPLLWAPNRAKVWLGQEWPFCTDRKLQPEV